MIAKALPGSAFEWDLLSKKQFDSIRKANHRANLWHGAVRSGKTVGSIVRWLKHIEEMKNAKGHFLMTGVTIGTLKDNILDPIEAMVGPENYRYSSGSRDVYICGIRVLIRGAGDESAEKKIRGLTLKGHYGDECTLWPSNYYKRGMDRLSVKGAKFFGTTNPDSPYHWLKTEFIDRGINGTGETDLLDFHFELEDNNSLETEYVENLKKEFSGLWYKRFILGLWVVAEGAIYNMFNEDEHVVDELPVESLADFEKVIHGVDYGTSNPTAFIALGLHKGTWYAFDEYRYHKPERARTDEEHSKALQEFITRGGVLPHSSIEVDPSAASFKTQLKRDGVKRVHEADNEVLDGIRVVAAGLTSGRLKIHSSCKHLIKEFMTYVWDPKAQEERGEDKPIKQHDHHLDSTRYACKRALGRRKKDVLIKPKGY